MREKYLTNARIIDPKNQIDEIGGLIIDTKGLIKAIGKKVTNGNLPADAERIDLKKQILIPGIVDMRVFVGEPGFCLLYTSPSPRDATLSRMPSSA